jgi:histidinol-phosphate aminotransferase
VFQTRETCDAITDRTRIVFLTNPNNPSGQLVPRSAIVEIAQHLGPGGTVVVDEAYYDFCGETFLPDLERHPNVVVGRTFAKAHGLAGLRAGCLIGDPQRLDAVRQVVPPFSMSVFAAVGWQAALKDRKHLDWYRAQVAASRELVYAACERLSLPYWRSAGNFVLIDVSRAGNPASIAEAFADRGILVRDRSRDPGCRGCIRITAGVVEHTRKALDVLEELCAVP